MIPVDGIMEDAEAEHTIELRMNDKSESKKFTLMAIGYNQIVEGKKNLWYTMVENEARI